MYNFVVLFCMYMTELLLEGVKKNRYRELNELVNVRMLKNKTYFKKNNVIKTQYKFIKKLLTNYKKCIYY